jgi:hypothetical protein
VNGHGQFVQAVYVELLRVRKHRVLLVLCFRGSLFCQFRCQATELPHTGVSYEHVARSKNRDALHPPLRLLRQRKTCAHLRRLKWVRWMHGKLIALLDYPFMIFHHLALKGQGPHIFGCQPESLALAKAASVGN